MAHGRERPRIYDVYLTRKGENQGNLSLRNPESDVPNSPLNSANTHKVEEYCSKLSKDHRIHRAFLYHNNQKIATCDVSTDSHGQSDVYLEKSNSPCVVLEHQRRIFRPWLHRNTTCDIQDPENAGLYLPFIWKGYTELQDTRTTAQLDFWDRLEKLFKLELGKEEMSYKTVLKFHLNDSKDKERIGFIEVFESSEAREERLVLTVMAMLARSQARGRFQNS